MTVMTRDGPSTQGTLRPAFGDAVVSLMASVGGGLSLRQAEIRTGVDINTLSRMRSGIVPRVDKVEAFARGFGANVNDWRELAGYPRLDVESSSDRFWRLFGDAHGRLAREGIYLPAPTPEVDSSAWQEMTPEQIDDLLAQLEAAARAQAEAPEPEPSVPRSALLEQIEAAVRALRAESP
ncbi:MAG: helix-turn-helix domain-containing protein [Armatimonadetes bacterium]|nr:helix-turn-helix domain-containing protein [Armatimonadota bacterium]